MTSKNSPSNSKAKQAEPIFDTSNKLMYDTKRDAKDPIRVLLSALLITYASKDSFETVQNARARGDDEKAKNYIKRADAFDELATAILRSPLLPPIDWTLEMENLKEFSMEEIAGLQQEWREITTRHN